MDCLASFEFLLRWCGSVAGSMLKRFILGKPLSQRLTAAMNAGSDRADGAAGEGGDSLVGEAADEGEHDGVAVDRRERGERFLQRIAEEAGNSRGFRIVPRVHEVQRDQ